MISPYQSFDPKDLVLQFGVPAAHRHGSLASAECLFVQFDKRADPKSTVGHTTVMLA